MEERAEAGDDRGQEMDGVPLEGSLDESMEGQCHHR